MRLISGAELKTVLDYRMLTERLRQMFRGGCDVPPRLHYAIAAGAVGPGTVGSDARSDAEGAVAGGNEGNGGNGADGTLLIMPAWKAGRHIGIKVVTVFPDNPRRDLPTVLGSFLLFDARTGTPQALIDGAALTARRTAAASALAATYLARPDSSRLLMVGTGNLAPFLIEAMQAVLPLRQVLVWGRTPARAEAIATRFKRSKLQVRATTDLEGAVRGADIITCATASREPLIRGAWLSEGVHLDLVGGFTPDMRETDDEVIRRARVFVDTRDGACREAGDIVQPLAAGVLSADDIAGDLYDLTRGERGGRRYYDQITLFKSVGTALEDLAAAELAVEMLIHRETLR